MRFKYWIIRLAIVISWLAFVTYGIFGVSVFSDTALLITIIILAVIATVFGVMLSTKERKNDD